MEYLNFIVTSILIKSYNKKSLCLFYMNITSPIVQFFIKIFNSQSFYANNINKNISLFVHSTRMQIMFYLISSSFFIPICPLIIHPFFLALVFLGNNNSFKFFSKHRVQFEISKSVG